MTISRRRFLKAGLGSVFSIGAIASGCVSYTPPPASKYDNRDWGRYSRAGKAKRPTLPRKYHYVGDVKVVSRKSWAGGEAKLSRATGMTKINKITVHHDAILMEKCSYDIAAKRMESIRCGHASKWADIGYHYTIDRDGRVWEGRSVKLQGAHVKNQNAGNVGVMVMGHFNHQEPSQAQKRSLVKVLKALQKKYAVKTSNVFTHRELMATACPGENLQRYMVQIRKNGTL